MATIYEPGAISWYNWWNAWNFEIQLKWWNPRIQIEFARHLLIDFKGDHAPYIAIDIICICIAIHIQIYRDGAE